MVLYERSTEESKFTKAGLTDSKPLVTFATYEIPEHTVNNKKFV